MKELRFETLPWLKSSLLTNLVNAANSNDPIQSKRLEKNAFKAESKIYVFWSGY